MDDAPRDGTPILAICHHESDPYCDSHNRLTIYGGHTEGFSHVCNGPHVIVWGGAYDDSTWEEPNAGGMPDWWFLYGSQFEVTANPIGWMAVPEFCLPTILEGTRATLQDSDEPDNPLENLL